MVNRLLEPLRGSRWLMFWALFITAFLYKLLLCWRLDILVGWQDELSWKETAKSEGFLRTVFDFDSGYPTPLLKMLSFLLSSFPSTNYLPWHFFSLCIIGLCVGSLALSKSLDFETRGLIALLLCSFPSFDLLLFHNLPYWTFIPFFVICSDLILAKSRLEPKVLPVLFALILMSAKPQILLVIVLLLLAVFIARVDFRIHFILPFSTALLLILIGRLSTETISLDAGLFTLYNYVFTINSHLLIVFAPMSMLLAFKTSKYLESPVIITIYFVVSSVTTFLFFSSRPKEVLARWKSLFTYSMFAIYAASLYIFPNSGWSNASLLISIDSVSIVSRHYLPIILILGFFVGIHFNTKRWLIWVFGVAISQNVLLQVVFYDQLYKAS